MNRKEYYFDISLEKNKFDVLLKVKSKSPIPVKGIDLYL
jgi:hypothetical protein